MKCWYCASEETTDCGDVLGDGSRHLECRACGMAFSVSAPVPVPEPSEGAKLGFGSDDSKFRPVPVEGEDQ